MVISDKFILIHLQKCGGTYLKHIIEDYFNGVNKRPEHNGVKDVIPNHKNRLLIGTIRNPWGWYVSLYHSHYQNPNSFFIDTFKDKPTFSEWLKRFINEDNKTYHDLNFKIISKMGIGPYTYRMLKCYTTDGSLNSDRISDKLRIIKTENNLASGFINLLEENKIPISEDIKNKITNTGKIHTSKHNHYSEYYNDECIELVKQKDKIIIDKFNYKYQHE